MIKHVNCVNKKIDIQTMIDDAGLFIIGLFSLGYFLFGITFAELHLKFTFLNFPVFVGEMALFACAILYSVKFYLCHMKFTKWHYLLIAYFIFVLFKALYGYHVWGPLAFRHAALFYYSAFAIFGYNFYRKSFFNPNVILFLLLLLFVSFITGIFYIYALTTGIIFSVVLIRKYPYKTMRYILFSFFLIILPYSSLFYTSRTMLISSLAVLIYLIISLFLILKVKKVRQLILAILLFSIGIGVVKLANEPERIKSFIFDGQALQTYDEYNNIIKKRESSLEEKEFEGVRLFNSGSGTDYSDRSVPKIKGMEKTQPEPEKVPLQTKPATVRIFNPGTGTDYSDRLVPKIEEMEKTQPELEKVPQVGVSQARPKHAGPIRPLGIEQGTIFFRLFIWRDMIKQLSDKKPVFGFDFGRPFRSRNLAILNWGQSECRKDGWIAAHNSYLEIVYRAGIVGILFILGIFTAVAILTKEFLQRKSVTGILLCGALISWLAMANFLVILELPYNAIPFWSLFGMTFAYSRHL